VKVYYSFVLAISLALNVYLLVNSSKVDNDNYVKADVWKSEVIQGIQNNDSNLYSKGSKFAIMTSNSDRLFFYSLLMALENNNTQAIYNMYFLLKHEYRNKKENERIIVLKKYLLAKLHERNNPLLPSELSKIKDNNGKINSSKYFLNLLGDI
jgi:hypothetical protein